MKLNSYESNWVARLLCLFLITDIGFFIIHLIHSYTSLTTFAGFSVEADRGYAEIFQFMKEFWSALLLGFVAFRRRLFPYLSWSLLFFYIFLDDALSLHERVGFFLGRRGLPSVLGISAGALGEIVVFVTAALLLLTGVAAAYRLGNPTFRKTSRTLIKLLVVLAVFGVLVDVIHNAITFPPKIAPLFGLLEDGGEMLVMSVMSCFVFLATDRLLADPDQIKDLKVLSSKVESSR